MNPIAAPWPIAQAPNAALDTSTIVMLLFAAAVAGYFLLMIVAVVVTEKRKGKRLELLHEQRMKALEIGRELPDDRPRPVPGRAAAIAIGLGVPALAFSAALVFSLVVRETNWVGFSQTHMVWTAAGGVSLAAVVCGTILASRLPRTASNSDGSSGSGSLASRTSSKNGMADPDAIDVSSRRGGQHSV